MGQADYFSARAGHGPFIFGPGGTLANKYLLVPPTRVASINNFKGAYLAKLKILTLVRWQAAKKHPAIGPYFGLGCGPTHSSAQFIRRTSVIYIIFASNSNSRILQRFLSEILERKIYP